MVARATLEPVILLLGAKSTVQPLESIPHELSQLEGLLTRHQATSATAFEIKHYPYFTRSQLAEKLNQLQNRVAILHFAGHSSDEGVLTDDELVYSRHIADHIGTWRIPPALIVLNGCHNAAQVNLFHKAGVSVVIATHRAIDDKLAAGFAQAFYSAMLSNPKTTTLQTAFAQASSNTLMGENRQVRSLDIDDDSPATWDWDLFPQQDKQREWTFHDLLTTARPVLDADGKLYNPYKGLEAFREEDQSWFFGREALTDELLATLALPGKPPPRFFSLLGASGSGKSSVINAGVVPKLRDRQPAALILQTRPGAEPFKELAALITRQLYPDSISQQMSEAKALAEQLAQPDAILPDLIKRLLETGRHSNPHLYLFIDQFEELFTHSQHQQVQRYLQQLVALIESDVPCTLVIIMRADFLASALAHPQFAGHIDAQPHKMLSPMSEAELRTAIERPAQRQQVELEPGLTSTLLRDVENQPGSLPLLQYVLSLLWEKQEQQQDKLIQLEEYTAFGGLSKALEERANSLYRSFTPEQQQLCQRIFLRLVQPGEGTGDTRRRAGLHEFSTAAEQAVIQQLANARLITTQGSETVPNGNGANTSEDSGNNHSAYAEVSHEALIRTWSQLKEWIEANRDELRTQHQISADAQDWLEHKKAKDWLLTGTRVAVAEEWLKKSAERATTSEIAFIKASITQQKRRRQITITSTVFAFIMLIVVAVIMTLQRQEAETAKAEADKKILEVNYNLAKVFEEKALNLIDDDLLRGKPPKEPLQARKAWLYGLEAANQKVLDDKVAILPSTLGHLETVREQDLSTERKQMPALNIGIINAVAFNPDGKMIATGGNSTRVRLWDASTGKIIKTLQGHTGFVTSVAFSPDGKIIASGAEDNTVRLWDAQSGEPLQTLQGHTGFVTSVAFSLDGKIIASGAEDNTVRLWDAQSGEPLQTLQGHTSFVTSVAFSPDGKVIASGAKDNTVRLWGAHNGEPLQTLQGHTGFVTPVAFSPDGKIIASGAEDKSVRLWDTQSGEPLQTLQGHTGFVTSVAFSPDGKIIASGATDNTVRLWDAQSDAPLKTLQGHTGWVRSVAFNPDGKVIATGSYDNTVRLWDTQSGEPLKTLQGHTGRVRSVAFSPDGKAIATGSGDNTVQLWDATNGVSLKTLLGHTDRVSSVAYSPDGKIIASGAEDSTVRLWDTSTGKIIKTLQDHTGPVSSVAYSPDGKIIASGAEDNTIQLWDASTGETLKTLQGHTGSISSVIYSPDSKTIASGSFDRTVRLWDVASGEILKTLKGHTGLIISVAFSPDGKVIASGSKDNTVRLWNASTGETLTTLQGHTGPVLSVAYSPDGKVIATGSSDKTVRLWDAHSGESLKTLQGHTDSANSVAYSPDGKVIATGSDDNTVRLWGINTEENLKILKGHTHPVLSVAFSPDGKIIASGAEDSTVRLWDTSTGETLTTLQGHTDPVSSVVFSPDGKVIATGSFDNTVRLWDARSGTSMRTLQKESLGSIYSIAFSPDGKVIATGSYDNTVSLWDTHNGSLLRTLEGHTYPVYSVAFSPDGKMIATGSMDGTMRLWDIYSGETLKILEGHTDSVHAVAFSPDSKVIATGLDNNTVLLLDTHSGEILKTLKGHTSTVSSVAFSPNGKLIVTGSMDHTVRLWDMHSGKTLETLYHMGSVSSVMFNPTGKTIAAGSYDNTVRLWNVTSPVFRLVYDFDLAKVSAVLRFVWEMDRDELQIIQKPRPPSLFLQMGYYISWTAETCQYRPLLDMPKPDETKLAQVVRFLEDRCAYQKNNPALKTCKVSDAIKQQIADCEANYPKAEAD